MRMIRCDRTRALPPSPLPSPPPKCEDKSKHMDGYDELVGPTGFISSFQGSFFYSSSVCSACECVCVLFFYPTFLCRHLTSRCYTPAQTRNDSHALLCCCFCTLFHSLLLFLSPRSLPSLRLLIRYIGLAGCWLLLIAAAASCPLAMSPAHVAKYALTVIIVMTSVFSVVFMGRTRMKGGCRSDVFTDCAATSWETESTKGWRIP
jgi:hypothetical protein